MIISQRKSDPSSDPAFLMSKSRQGKAFTRHNLVNYMDEFERIILSATIPVDVEDIYPLFKAKKNSVREKLKDYISIRTEVISRGLLVGFYPAPYTVIEIAEGRLGAKISPSNLSDINAECKAIIDGISKPRHERFIEDFLSGYMVPGTDCVKLKHEDLVEFIYEDYNSFASEAGNGVVSLAGALNESIFVKALENAGLKQGVHFERTGKNSEADLLVKESRGTKSMHCEIKSYAARERLLRGLQDIDAKDKIGVGFFNNPKEFGPTRTDTLLGSRAQAIYMPDDTFSKVSPASKAKKTKSQDSLYRPLSRFVSDMIHYYKLGSLPKYP